MIVTARACWIIALAFGTAVTGLAKQEALIFGIGFTCLVWVFFEWVSFRIRVDFLLPTAERERIVSDRVGKPVRVFWEDRTVYVRTRLEFRRRWWLPSIFADVRDMIPTAAERVDRTTAAGVSKETDGALSRTNLADDMNGVRFALGSQRELDFEYCLRPRTVGSVKFIGLRFVLNDQHGFFQAERFLSLPQSYRVLPLATEIGMPVSIRKQHNRLPPPGIHTVSRAGVGSELLEIRDYVPGDSPRSIAWKVSARRDALMSKQFETEVPVRCQLLIDMSRAVRRGYPGPSQGSRLVSLAATIAHTLASNRDPVGVSIFNGQDVKISKPSASRKSVLRMFDQVSSALDQPLQPVDSPVGPLLRQALDVARIRYPRAFEEAYARLSGWLPRRRDYYSRVRMAAILTNHYRLRETAMGQLVENELLLSHWLQQFLYDHQAPYTGALFDDKGNYLFDDHEKINQLAKLLNRYVARGRDNELFVVMAELTDAEYDLAPLVKAIKVARARHHRVMVLCAWPHEMPPPQPVNLSEKATTPNPLLSELQQKSYAFHRLRNELGKLRVPVVSTSEQQATLLVMNQLEVVRTGRFVAG